MSKPQYDYFILTNPPCGSSYQALKLDYSIKRFILDWVAPQPGDYYILLENTSMYVIAYSIQLSAIEPATTIVYTTTAILQTLTFIQQQEVNATATQPESAKPAQSDFTIPIAIALVAAAMLIAGLARRSKRFR
jgi:hypothetical protein